MKVKKKPYPGMENKELKRLEALKKKVTRKEKSNGEKNQVRLVGTRKKK